MKIKFLLTGFLALATAAAFAQKGELSSAHDNYDKFTTSYNPKAPAIINKVAIQSLNDAKTSIDKASTNAKTATLPETYAVKAGVYSSLAALDSVPATSIPLFNQAEEALKKAKETDTKGEFSKLTSSVSRNMAQYQLNIGIKAYQTKDYNNAYKAFDYSRSFLPTDTTLIYYTAIAADNAHNYQGAITNYNALLGTNFSKNQDVYMDISRIYLLNKDTTGALKVVGQGVAKYPANADLRKREIEISLQSGRTKEVMDKINSAIANDPKNKQLYFYSGLTYSTNADNITDQIKKEKDPAAKAKLQAAKDENLTKAAEQYRKALEIDPNYFDANLNLGYVLLSPAIDLYNAANKLPASRQKEYEADLAKAAQMFAVAKPYVTKAAELDPKNYNALLNLKNFYIGTKDSAHAAEVQKQIDALK